MEIDRVVDRTTSRSQQALFAMDVWRINDTLTVLFRTQHCVRREC